MSYEKRLQESNVTIGTKQTTRMVELGKALEVFLARDADPRLTGKVAGLCKKTGIQVTYIDTMKQLGKACGIEVGAAMAAIVRD
jgi:large subunit ribosomal protein L7A